MALLHAPYTKLRPRSAKNLELSKTSYKPQAICSIQYNIQTNLKNIKHLYMLRYTTIPRDAGREKREQTGQISCRLA